MKFDQLAWASEEKPDWYTYEIIGVSPRSLKVIRNDKGVPQIFTRVVYQRLLSEKKLEILSPTSFRTKRDTDYNPNSEFTELD